MSQPNIVVTIQLPQGFALTNGAQTIEPMQFQVVSGLTPYYSSVDLVRLNGGIYLRKVSDLTIAGMIYYMSKNADALTWSLPMVPPSYAPFTDFQETHYRNFVMARVNWVTYSSAKQLILNMFDLNAVRGSKTLANFSVSRQDFSNDSGVPGKLKDLDTMVKDWELALMSGGSIGYKGHVKPRMAAKGLYDDSDNTPGRTWLNSGPGANTYSMTGVSSSGGRSKTVKFYSPVVVGNRIGRYFGPTVLVTWPRVPSY
jgi:hypothetical protein